MDGNTPTSKYGGVAQLGEHLLCKQGVIGSIPFISTSQTESGRNSPLFTNEVGASEVCGTGLGSSRKGKDVH